MKFAHRTLGKGIAGSRLGDKSPSFSPAHRGGRRREGEISVGEIVDQLFEFRLVVSTDSSIPIAVSLIDAWLFFMTVNSLQGALARLVFTIHYNCKLFLREVASPLQEISRESAKDLIDYGSVPISG